MSELANSTALITGNANPLLTKELAKYLNIQTTNIEISQFNDGEIRAEIYESIRGKTAVIVQSISDPVNDNLMELLILGDTARRSGASSLIAVIPYFGYSRQDRRPGFTRTPITARLIADMIQTAGFDRVVTVDIHSAQQQGFFSIPYVNVSASVELVADIWKRYGENVVIVSPDIGGVGRARAIAKQLNNADLAIIDKRRPEPGQSEVMNIIGTVQGKKCIIIDDIIDTAGTLCKAAEAIKQRGAVSVSAYATHPVFSGQAYENITNSVLDKVIVSNTIQLFGSVPNIIEQIPITSVLGETINRLLTNRSISALYIDE